MVTHVEDPGYYVDREHLDEAPMTDGGTPPPSRRPTPIVPAAGRPANVSEIPTERLGFMRNAGNELIEFESFGHAPIAPPATGARDPWAREAAYPIGVVRGETYTSLLPKAGCSADAASLPNVVVSESRRASGPDARGETLPAARAVLATPLIAGEELVLGGPEPADWVRLPDPRTAPTEPSLRRRSWSESLVSPDAPTPVEPNPERRRERLRNAVVLGIGALVAVIGLSALVVTSLVAKENLAAPASPMPMRAIEAARTATLPDDIPPPPAPVVPRERTSVVSVEAAPAVQPSMPSNVVRKSAENVLVKPARNALGEPDDDELPLWKANTAPKAPQSSRIVRVQGGRVPSSAAQGASSPTSNPRSSSASPTQPKKRLWFPPE